ncbi:hypothetical protein GCM10009747_20860 [Agromyces humatus]|uniref:Uncharacterized protein n=1 Tax=Agromyces humatus TaxID=279573 RepID=A0ABN2KQB5_9MICO
MQPVGAAGNLAVVHFVRVRQRQVVELRFAAAASNRAGACRDQMGTTPAIDADRSVVATRTPEFTRASRIRQGSPFAADTKLTLRRAGEVTDRSTPGRRKGSCMRDALLSAVTYQVE